MFYAKRELILRLAATLTLSPFKICAIYSGYI